MMRDAAGGAAASSPSAAAARTVAKSSPRAFRSPGGATPGAVAAATAEPNGPQGLDELRGEFVFWDGMWRQVVAAGPKQTTAVAVTFLPPDSAGQLPDEKWEVATVKKVFGTADFLDALQHQKAVPADSWEHAVSEHSRGVQSCMALNAASRSLGFPRKLVKVSYTHMHSSTRELTLTLNSRNSTAHTEALTLARARAHSV